MQAVTINFDIFFCSLQKFNSFETNLNELVLHRNCFSAILQFQLNGVALRKRWKKVEIWYWIESMSLPLLLEKSIKNIHFDVLIFFLFFSNQSFCHMKYHTEWMVFQPNNEVKINLFIKYENHIINQYLMSAIT